MCILSYSSCTAEGSGLTVETSITGSEAAPCYIWRCIYGEMKFAVQSFPSRLYSLAYEGCLVPGLIGLREVERCQLRLS